MRRQPATNSVDVAGDISENSNVYVEICQNVLCTTL